jgi:peptidyl-prolyl cis-trans isomerase C
MFSHSVRLLAALSLCVSMPVYAQTAAPKAPAPKPVTVNGKPIPKARLEFIVKQRANQGQPDNEQARKAILDNLIAQEVVAQEAERRGFAKSADVRAQLELARQQVMVQALIQEHLKAHPVKDDEMLAEYNKLKASRGDKEYKARHILVDKDSEANEIIAQLKKGTKFEDLAKQSKDPGSKEKGGDLDWNPPSTFVKPFAEALAKLERGNTPKPRCRPSSAGTSYSSTTSAQCNSPRSTRSSSSCSRGCRSRKCRSSSASCARRRRSSKAGRPSGILLVYQRG